MKVRCRLTVLTPEQRARIGGTLADRNAWAVSAGDDYVVLGLTFSFGTPALGTGSWIEYENPRQGEYILTAPMDLFQVVEGTPSSIWELRADHEMVTLWPHSFYVPGYHDRLSDGAVEEL